MSLKIFQKFHFGHNFPRGPFSKVWWFSMPSGNTVWSLLLETRLDILSFDAYSYLENLSLYPKGLKTFLERGAS
ncbi:MAG: hypothetical protein ABSB22_19790 [Thermodesulfobacteriota bacterium]